MNVLDQKFSKKTFQISKRVKKFFQSNDTCSTGLKFFFFFHIPPRTHECQNNRVQRRCIFLPVHSHTYSRGSSERGCWRFSMTNIIFPGASAPLFHEFRRLSGHRHAPRGFYPISSAPPLPSPLHLFCLRCWVVDSLPHVWKLFFDAEVLLYQDTLDFFVLFFFLFGCGGWSASIFHALIFFLSPVGS